MRKKLLLLLLGACSFTTSAFALEDGEYVYTRDARYQVVMESENLVTNGYFTNTDVSSSDFGWTDEDGATLNTSYIGVEPSAGPNGENVLLSTSASSSLYQAVPYTSGKRYIITFYVKAETATVTVYGSSSASNLIDIYAMKDPTGDKDDDNCYQQIAGYDAISTSWSQISYEFSDTTGYDGYIVLLLSSLDDGTYVGNFDIREADLVGDDRELGDFLDNALLLINSGQFENDTNDFAGEVQGIYELFVNDQTSLGLDDYDNAASLLEALEELEEEWLDENAADVSDQFTSFDPADWVKINNNQSYTSYGSWVLSGCDSRWGHPTDETLYVTEYANASYPGSSSYVLPEGWAYLTNDDMPYSGTYMFSMETYAVVYNNSLNGYAGSTDYYIPNYNSYVTGAYIFFNNDTTFIDTLDNYSAKRYYVFGELEEGDTLNAGIYFPGFTNGGIFYFGGPIMRKIGVTEEDYENDAYLASIIVQQNALLTSINAGIEDLAEGLPWANDTLEWAIEYYTELYNATLAYVTADGELADGVSFDDIPEDYDETIEDYEDAMESVRDYYADANEPYTTLVAYVVEAQAVLDSDAYSGASSSTRTTLETEIAESNALIAAVSSDVENGDEFTTAYEELVDAVVSFQSSCASFTNPTEITYTNNSFQYGAATDWDDYVYESSNGRWKFGTDENFLDGYAIYSSRGYTAAPCNYVGRYITITEPGVYEFYCQAYATNTYETYYNSLWNSMTGEDSVRTANINVFCGLYDEEVTYDVFGYQENFGTSYWYYDDLLDITIQYIKTTDSSVSEELHFGFDALSNGYDDYGEALSSYTDSSITCGANIYGFGSTHLYYYGTEESYADGIAAAKAEQAQSDDYVYSLSGVRMGKSSDSLPKGIYISNGQKFIVK